MNISEMPEYVVWGRIKQRCSNPNHDRWDYYGGRGICVCKRWSDDFQAFLTDMGPRPSLDHSIERDDVNGNYEPGNCRWVWNIEQYRNTRRSVHVEFRGDRVLLLDLAARFGLNLPMLYGRIKMGWSVEDAVSKPVRRKKSNRARSFS